MKNGQCLCRHWFGPNEDDGVRSSGLAWIVDGSILTCSLMQSSTNRFRLTCLPIFLLSIGKHLLPCRQVSTSPTRYTCEKLHPPSCCTVPGQKVFSLQKRWLPCHGRRRHANTQLYRDCSGCHLFMNKPYLLFSSVELLRWRESLQC